MLHESWEKSSKYLRQENISLNVSCSHLSLPGNRPCAVKFIKHRSCIIDSSSLQQSSIKLSKQLVMVTSCLDNLMQKSLLSSCEIAEPKESKCVTVLLTAVFDFVKFNDEIRGKPRTIKELEKFILFKFQIPVENTGLTLYIYIY